jgi:hypothetical protein
MRQLAIAAFILNLTTSCWSWCADEISPASALAVDLSLRGKVVGPETVSTGQMLKLKAALTVTRDETTTVLLESPGDGCPTAYEWELTNPPPGYSVSEWIGDDGRTLTFSTDQPGDYHFVLAISKWTGGQKPLLRLTRYTLTVTPRGPPKPPTCPPTSPPTGPPITPTDPPSEPPPDPKPPTDDELHGLYGLAPKVRDAIPTMVPQNQRHHATALADVYRDAAKAVIKGELTALNAAGKLKQMNAAVLTTPEERKAWEPFFQWLGEEMMMLASHGKLNSAKGVVTALSEISLGMALADGGN